MWPALVALSETDEGISLTLTPLERTIALTVFSSLSPAELFDFETDAERQEARDTMETIVSKLMGALNV
jgi:hypothetical protein